MTIGAALIAEEDGAGFGFVIFPGRERASRASENCDQTKASNREKELRTENHKIIFACGI